MRNEWFFFFFKFENFDAENQIKTHPLHSRNLPAEKERTQSI